MTEQSEHGYVPTQPSEGATEGQRQAAGPPDGPAIYAPQPPAQPHQAPAYPPQPSVPTYAHPGYVQQPVYVQAPMVGFVHTTPDKSVGVAYLLLIFLGVFGVHQFYLGKAGRGVGYLFTAAWLTAGMWIDLFTLPSQVRAVNTQRRMGIR